MQAYSLDLRKRVLADGDAGLKTKVVAEKYGVSRTWVRSLKQRRRETGEIGPRHGRPGRKRKIDRGRLGELVAEDADATLVELRERLGVPCALSAIWKALRQLKITFKKKRCGRPNRTGPTSRSAVRPGASSNSASTPRGSSLSTKRGPRRT
jgi:transposase